MAKQPPAKLSQTARISFVQLILLDFSVWHILPRV